MIFKESRSRTAVEAPMIAEWRRGACNIPATVPLCAPRLNSNLGKGYMRAQTFRTDVNRRIAHETRAFKGSFCQA
jgi:hypothetical protein